MKLIEEISEELYQTIAPKYENGDYSGAVVDSIKYMTELIRSAVDNSEDGAKLVQVAFEGNTPILKFNKMESESEINEHRGLTLILKGIYMGIRNPRAHEIYTDSKEDSDLLIIFIDYLIKKIKRIKPIQNLFDLEEYRERVFDPSFPNKYEYAEILVNEIPPKEILNVAYDILEKRYRDKTECLTHFFKAIYGRMDSEQHKMLINYFSEKLRKIHRNKEIIDLIRYIAIKPELWQVLPDDVKIRTEAKIIESVKNGHYDKYQGLKTGALGTWAMSLGEYFHLRKDLGQALIDEIGGDWYTQNYVGNWFVYELPSIIQEEYLTWFIFPNK